MRSKNDIFDDRMAAFGSEMKDIYMALYQDECAYDYFCSMLKKMYDNRKGALRKIDAARVKNPDWYRKQNLLGMQLYTQCFAGILSGVEERLNYMEECGVNYIHLMPLLDSPKERSDGGYSVADFRKVMPELGTMKELEKLADTCHKRDMVLCIDFVMNHTSSDHQWAVDAKNGDTFAMGRYFFYDNWDVPNEFEKTVPQVFPTTAPGSFSWCPELGKVVMTSFYPYQWDLNYANPVVLNDMTENLLYLCNRGIDVIRLDAVPYIWKELGTNCRNLPQVHALVRLLHLATNVVAPGVVLLGEVVMEPDKLAPYFGDPWRRECHMLYNATTMCTTWHTVATHDVRLLRRQMDIIAGLPKENVFLNYLRCHDDIGWGLDYDFLKHCGMEQVAHKKFLNDYFRGYAMGSPSRGELYNDDPRLGDARLCGTTASLCGMEADAETGLKLDIMLHAFLLTQQGMPIIYSGDEVAQLNDYSYHQDPVKWDDSRYIHRGNFDWDKAGNRHNKDTSEGKLFATIKELVDIRSGEKSFAPDADVWTMEPYNDNILVVGRYCDGEKLLALFNFSKDEQVAWINEEEEYVNILSGKSYIAKALALQGYGFLWLKTTY